MSDVFNAHNKAFLKTMDCKFDINSGRVGQVIKNNMNIFLKKYYDTKITIRF